MDVNASSIRLDEIKMALTKLNFVIKVLEQRKGELLLEENQLKGKIVNLDKQLFPWTEELCCILRNTFKFNSFRAKQLSTINSLLNEKDVILIMSSAGGKTLTYQIPAILYRGLTLVITPLNSSTEDQLWHLQKLGIRAKTINDNVERTARKEIYKSMITFDSPLKVLLVSADWLFKSNVLMDFIQKSCEKKILKRVVIDDIHCCSSWGHDFRVEYKKLEFFKAKFPNIPILGLTSTATQEVVIDIKKQLHLTNAEVFNTSLNRHNLFYKVVFKPEKGGCVDTIANWMKVKYNGMSGIIYVSTNEESIEVSSELIQRGILVRPYHSEMDMHHRTSSHKQWLNNTYQALVATSAFGMGINKPDIRFVIHHTMPKNLESYYQESGRAGRDGLYADCILMFSLQDYFKLFCSINAPQEKQLKTVLGYCLEQISCRRTVLLGHLKESLKSTDCFKMCDLCVNNVPLTRYFLNSAVTNISDIVRNFSLCSIKIPLVMLIKSLEEIFNLYCPPQYMEYVIGFLLYEEYFILDRDNTPYLNMAHIKVNKHKEWPKWIIMHHRDMFFDFSGMIAKLPDDDNKSIENASLTNPLTEASSSIENIGFGKEINTFVELIYELIKIKKGADVANDFTEDFDFSSFNINNFDFSDLLAISSDFDKAPVEKDDSGANNNDNSTESHHTKKGTALSSIRENRSNINNEKYDSVANYNGNNTDLDNSTDSQHPKEGAVFSPMSENINDIDKGKDDSGANNNDDNIYPDITSSRITDSHHPKEAAALSLSSENRININKEKYDSGANNYDVNPDPDISTNSHLPKESAAYSPTSKNRININKEKDDSGANNYDVNPDPDISTDSHLPKESAAISHSSENINNIDKEKDDGGANDNSNGLNNNKDLHLPKETAAFLSSDENINNSYMAKDDGGANADNNSESGNFTISPHPKKATVHSRRLSANLKRAAVFPQRAMLRSRGNKRAIEECETQRNKNSKSRKIDNTRADAIVDVIVISSSSESDVEN